MELKKIDYSNIWKVIKLSVEKEQDNFVASNTESLLEAYIALSSGNIALPFGIYDGELLVGFVMLGYGKTDDEDEPQIAGGNYCLWRLMIDKTCQNKGYGKKAVAKILDYVKTFPSGHADYIWLSYEPENVCAKHLYARFGFTENGEMCGDEIIAVKKL